MLGLTTHTNLLSQQGIEFHWIEEGLKGAGGPPSCSNNKIHTRLIHDCLIQSIDKPQYPWTERDRQHGRISGCTVSLKSSYANLLFNQSGITVFELLVCYWRFTDQVSAKAANRKRYELFFEHGSKTRLLNLPWIQDYQHAVARFKHEMWFVK